MDFDAITTKVFGERLKEIREDKGYTQEEGRQIAIEWFRFHQGKLDTSGMTANEIRAMGEEIDRRYKQATDQTKRELEIKTAQRNREIRCPSCGSNQVTAGNKGFGLGKAATGGLLLGPVGLLSGLIGSKQVVVTCLKCGKQWKAGSV